MTYRQNHCEDTILAAAVIAIGNLQERYKIMAIRELTPEERKLVTGGYAPAGSRPDDRPGHDSGDPGSHGGNGGGTGRGDIGSWADQRAAYHDQIAKQYTGGSLLTDTLNKLGGINTTQQEIDAKMSQWDKDHPYNRNNRSGNSDDSGGGNSGSPFGNHH